MEKYFQFAPTRMKKKEKRKKKRKQGFEPKATDEFY